MQLYGVPGWGSVLAEAALAWTGEHYEFVDVEGFDRPGPSRERLLAVNPLAQVPTLVLPDGEVMTESVAIALLLAERRPGSGLAPPPGDARRARFLRRLVWFGAAVYPTFTIGDYPERFAPRDADGLRANALARRIELWRQLEADAGEGPWLLGAAPSALDAFLSAMSRWTPRRAWFDANCPRLARIARAADALPALAPVWRRNFPDG